MLKFGIIGAGRLGSFHADKAAAHPRVELVGAFDPSEAAREALAEKHGVAAFENLDTMLPQVDAVVIATPSVTHHAIGLRCLQSGCHVLMEKPLCVTSGEAAQLVHVAKNQKRVLQVGHVEQFNPAWHAAAPILDNLAFGEKALIEAVRTSGYTFRSTDIGTVLDMMVHDLDLVLSVIPSAIRSVEAIGFYVIDPDRKHGHEDTVHARLMFENGTVALFHASRVAHEAVRRMNITMAGRSARIDFGTRETRLVESSENILDGTFAPNMVSGSEAAAIAPSFMKEQFHITETQGEAVDALALEMNDFVDAIEHRYEPKVTGRQGMAAVKAAEMILDAIRHAEFQQEKRAA